MSIPDNYDLWEEHDRKQTEWVKRRPRCADCDNEIQDEFAYYINGEWYEDAAGTIPWQSALL